MAQAEGAVSKEEIKTGRAEITVAFGI